MVRLTSLLIFLLLFVQADVFTQQRHQRMQEGRDRIETLRQVKMIEALNLDEETAARLSVFYKRHQDKIRDLHQEIENLIDELESAIDEDKPDNVLRQIRSGINEKRNTIHENRVNLYLEIEDILTPRQVAKLIVFERNFNRDLRQIMREVQRDRRRGR